MVDPCFFMKAGCRSSDLGRGANRHRYLGCGVNCCSLVVGLVLAVRSDV